MLVQAFRLRGTPWRDVFIEIFGERLFFLLLLFMFALVALFHYLRGDTRLSGEQHVVVAVDVAIHEFEIVVDDGCIRMGIYHLFFVAVLGFCFYKSFREEFGALAVDCDSHVDGHKSLLSDF